MNYFKQISIVLCLFLIFSGCDLVTDPEVNACDETKKAELIAVIFPNVKVITDEHYENGDIVPAGNVDVSISIWKQYCSDVENGFFSAETTTDENGWAVFGMQYEYKFANTKDYVFLNYYIESGENRTEYRTRIYYSDIEEAIEGYNGKRILEMYYDKYPDGLEIDWYDWE